MIMRMLDSRHELVGIYFTNWLFLFGSKDGLLKMPINTDIKYCVFGTVVHSQTTHGPTNTWIQQGKHTDLQNEIPLKSEQTW